MGEQPVDARGGLRRNLKVFQPCSPVRREPPAADRGVARQVGFIDHLPMRKGPLVGAPATPLLFRGSIVSTGHTGTWDVRCNRDRHIQQARIPVEQPANVEALNRLRFEPGIPRILQKSLRLDWRRARLDRGSARALLAHRPRRLLTTRHGSCRPTGRHTSRGRLRGFRGRLRLFLIVPLRMLMAHPGAAAHRFPIRSSGCNPTGRGTCRGGAGWSPGDADRSSALRSNRSLRHRRRREQAIAERIHAVVCCQIKRHRLPLDHGWHLDAPGSLRHVMRHRRNLRLTCRCRLADRCGAFRNFGLGRSPAASPPALAHFACGCLDADRLSGRTRLFRRLGPQQRSTDLL